MTFMGRIPGMVPVCVGKEVVVSVLCKGLLNVGWGSRV
jgi:hypothetical protein